MNSSKPEKKHSQQRVAKEPMNGSKQKKNNDNIELIFWKSQFSNFKKMLLKRFELLAKIMIDNFLIKLSQIEKHWINR